MWWDEQLWLFSQIVTLLTIITFWSNCDIIENCDFLVKLWSYSGLWLFGQIVTSFSKITFDLVLSFFGLKSFFIMTNLRFQHILLFQNNKITFLMDHGISNVSNGYYKNDVSGNNNDFCTLYRQISYCSVIIRKHIDYLILKTYWFWWHKYKLPYWYLMLKLSQGLILVVGIGHQWYWIYIYIYIFTIIS